MSVVVWCVVVVFCCVVCENVGSGVVWYGVVVYCVRWLVNSVWLCLGVMCCSIVIELVLI